MDDSRHADCLTLSPVGIREPAQGAEDIPFVDGDGQDRTEKTVRHFLDQLDLLFQCQSPCGDGIVIPGRIDRRATARELQPGM